MATKKRTIVAAILAKLNLTEEGKVDHFFDKAAKVITRNIEALEHNLKSLAFNHTAALNKIDEQIEDATETVESAYKEVVVDNIKTNSDQDIFLPLYWGRIDNAEEALASLKDSRKVLVEGYNDEVTKTKNQIKAYNDRLSRIS
jgi:predicted  nucleic acid-binding Zn-ribbon protein